MPCIFNIKPEDRHCQYCTATICDERQPKLDNHTMLSEKWYIEDLKKHLEG